MNQYIPAGSEVVIFQNGAHKWYTTKSDIPVVNPKPEMCPVREMEAVTMIHKGFTLWFMESQVRVALTEEQEIAARNLQLVKLEYDIPTRVTRAGVIEHPSQYLWARGVKTNLSVWVMPYGNVPWMRLRELTRAGCTWHVTRVDVSEAPNLIQRAIAALQVERIEAEKRREESLRSAEERFNDGQGDVNARIKRRSADLKRIEKALELARENVKKGANALGIPLDWVEGTSLRAQLRTALVTAPVRGEINASVSAIGAGNEAKASAVESAAKTLRKIGGDDALAMAKNLEDDEIDPKVVADFLEEHNEDTYSLRELFE